MTDLKDATITQLTDAIKALGYAPIIWSPEDFPSQQDFDENVKYVVDRCVEIGNEAIHDLCGGTR